MRGNIVEARPGTLFILSTTPCESLCYDRYWSVRYLETKVEYRYLGVRSAGITGRHLVKHIPAGVTVGDLLLAPGLDVRLIF